jgi:formate-nitrite transporter family protein
MAKQQHKVQKAEEEIQERTSPPGQIVYRAIHDEGENELRRDTGALAWSGLAAGLSMGFSLISQALLKTHLPDARWSPLIVNLGYTTGFLIVVLGRQQLFTENTLTVVLPYLAKRKISVLLNILRLWLTVLVANLAGDFAFASLIAHSPLFDADTRTACSELGRNVVQFSFGLTLLRAIFAGWLLALMVWLMPFAETGRIWVIVVITYLVGLANFSHIIAGGVEAFYLLATSEISIWKCLGGFVVPTLIGNILGGVAMVAILAHAQFMAAGRDEDHLKGKA